LVKGSLRCLPQVMATLENDALQHLLKSYRLVKAFTILYSCLLFGLVTIIMAFVIQTTPATIMHFLIIIYLPNYITVDLLAYRYFILNCSFFAFLVIYLLMRVKFGKHLLISWNQ